MASLLIGLGALVACSAPAADDASATPSDAAFTEGNYVQENDPHYWAPSTYDEFTTANLMTFGTQPPNVLADDHPLTERVQALLDRVDGQVRGDILARTGSALVAPKPMAKILISSATFNAWVSPAPACVGAPLGTSSAAGTGAFLDAASVQGFTLPAGACVHPPAWSPAGFVKYWDGGKLACTLAESGSTLSVGGKTCAVDATASAGADQLLVSATGQYVQFTTDLLAVVDETTLAVVAAHELGHYYRGHVTAKAQAKYNFWYTEDAAQAKTPVPAKNSAELQAAYAEVVQGVKPAAGPGFTSKYSARLRPLLLTGIAPLLTARTETNFVCAAARDAIGPWTSEILQAESPSDDARQAFLSFESKLFTCAPKLALSGEPDAGSVSAGAVLFAGAQLKPGPRTKVSITFGDNVGAFLSRIDASARDLDTKAQKLLQKMRDNQIGLYTVEQEADDFAMELATKLGLSVDDVLQAWVRFMDAADHVYLKTMSPDQLAAYYASIGEHDAASCKVLLDNGFKQDGVSVPMSLGALDEPHHTSCYRLYNLSREAAVHHYTAGPAQPALTPAWEDLRAEAASLAASAPQ